MPARRRRKSRTRAPATIAFSRADGEAVLHAQCQLSGRVVGPIRGHTIAAVYRATALLTAKCDCGRRCHQVRGIDGQPEAPLPLG